MTDLRARAKELAEEIGSQMLWGDAFGSNGLNYDDVEAALLAAFEAIRSEQIASTVSDEMVAVGERVLYTYTDDVEKRPPAETADFLRRLFRAMADASATAIRQAGEQK